MIKVTVETSLEDFEAWSGGKDRLDEIVELNIVDEIEENIIDMFGESLTDIELNDILWFELDDLIDELR